MPVYEYTALNAKGKTVSGIVDAESAPAARQKLRTSKIYPVDIKETRKSTQKKEPWLSGFTKSFARVKPVEVSLMTRQLATLVSAGFPLVTAIDTLMPQTKTQNFKKVLAEIKDSIVEGNSFASALTPYPGIFSPVYVNMVKAGESSGTLEIVLDRLADITEKQQALNSRIKAALAYPVLMSVIGALVLVFLITYIVPSIASIFSDMDQVLPMPTRILISISGFMKSFWWIFVIFAIVFFFIVRHIKKTPKGKHYLDKMILKTPGFGTIAKKLAVARMSRTLGSLLENGVTMLAALDIVENIVGNSLLRDAISKASEDVGKGQGLGASLADSNIFPNLFIQMIQVGEQSGELEAMLNKIADVYEREVESTVMSMTSLLEPVMILIMAVLVGFIVLSICLPIFEMNELVK